LQQGKFTRPDNLPP